MWSPEHFWVALEITGITGLLALPGIKLPTYLVENHQEGLPPSNLRPKKSEKLKKFILLDGKKLSFEIYSNLHANQNFNIKRGAGEITWR